MFNVNDVIIYGAQGVCKITGIEEKKISGAKRLYYVLESLSNTASTVYVPTDNEHVLKKMRRLMSTEEIHALIDAMPTEATQWIQNENERKECFKRIIMSGTPSELIKMIKSIYMHKKEREAEGKRLHMSDERFFKDAEQILYNEFQYVLELSCKSDLMTYIVNRIEGKK